MGSNVERLRNHLRSQDRKAVQCEIVAEWLEDAIEADREQRIPVEVDEKGNVWTVVQGRLNGPFRLDDVVDPGEYDLVKRPEDKWSTLRAALHGDSEEEADG